MTTNDILISIALLERTIPMLKEHTRETIRKDTFNSIVSNIKNSLSKLSGHCKDSTVMMPLMEIVELAEVINADPTFEETSKEIKDMLSTRIRSGLSALYLFAGKYYIDNEFTPSMGLDMLIRNIIDNCINQGFYFGIDVQLRQEGLI